MGKWFKQFKALVWFAGVALGCLIYVAATFATKEFVTNGRDDDRRVLDEVHKDVREIRSYLMEGKK
jgi:hypothetical protein